MRGVLRQVVLPRGDRLGELLLTLVGEAQKYSGVGDHVGRDIFLVRQQFLEPSDGLIVPIVRDVRLSDLERRPRGQFDVWETYDEAFRRGDAKFQVLFGRRLGQPVGARDSVGSLGEPLGFAVRIRLGQLLERFQRAIGVGIEQVLPGLARFDSAALGELN